MSKIPCQKRNVEVFDSNGAVIAGFWQYGTLQWDDFYKYISVFTEITTSWRIFCYDKAQHQHGALCPPDLDEVVQPGLYILLSLTGEPAHVELVSTFARLRNITPNYWDYDNFERDPHYHARGYQRDGRCVITGIEEEGRVDVAHIFPRAHAAEWVRRGYAGMITDMADEALMGGPTKIDSVQNVITLRADIHNIWGLYKFGVDPGNYRIIAFTNGCEDINGLHLQLDHIQDPTLRPLDELFRDHFMQGLLNHMKGTGETGWTYEEYICVHGEGREGLDLSNPLNWESTEGKERFELALTDRLVDRIGLIG